MRFFQWAFADGDDEGIEHHHARLHQIWTSETPFAKLPLDDPDAPQYCGEATVDIIAVHGLDSDYERAWSKKITDESGNESRYHWLREKLPKDMPDSRILSFSYPSSFFDDPTYTTLEEIGRKLLREIIRDRRHAGRLNMCPTRKKRPIVFVGHSFGGLVIKQALVLANEYITDKELMRSREGKRERQNYQDILSAVSGVLFLGTPHLGSPFSTWAEIKMAIGSCFGKATYPHLIKVLRVHSIELLFLQHEFERMYRKGKLSDVYLYCYWEERKMPLYPFIVVDPESACIPGADCFGLDANHKGLNKFDPGEDPNYELVQTNVESALQKTAKRIENSFLVGNFGTAFSADERRMVKHEFKPSIIHQRSHLSLKLSQRTVAPKSCYWILEQSDFRDWTARKSGTQVIWIHGKAGAGKSVLAAFLIDWLRTDFGQLEIDEVDEYNVPICRLAMDQNRCGYVKQTNTVLYYFFGVDRSNETVFGFLGTLVYQLLTAHHNNEKLFILAYRFAKIRSQNQSAMKDDVEGLIDLLSGMIDGLNTSVFIIVDGVEENHRASQGVACLAALSRLRSQTPDSRVRIMILSQVTDSISASLDTSFAQRKEFDICSYTKEDISAFILSKGTALIVKRPRLTGKKDEIVRYLEDGAQGMFQWVNGSINLLERYAGHPDDIGDCLKGLPTDLTETYEKIFKRMPSGNEAAGIQKRIRIALKLLAVCERPLTASEIWYAGVISTSENVESKVRALLEAREPLVAPEFALEEIRRLLDSLVDINDKGYVKLTHDSVRAALLKPDGNSAMYTDSDGNPLKIGAYQFTEQDANEEIASLCMSVCQSSTLSHATAFANRSIPFVEYSWEYWTRHFKRSSGAIGTLFDQMIAGVARDTVVFLSALTEFATLDMEAVPGHYSDLEYIMSSKRARESLLPAMEALTTILTETGTGLSALLTTYKSAVPPPSDLEETAKHSSYTACQKWAQDHYLRLRSRLKPKNTTVTQLRVDALFEKQQFKALPAQPQKCTALLEAARSLRTVALRFAVNPVYNSLLSRAGGSSFSPIHPLVYVAGMLEEAGSYPYWDHLTQDWDMLDPFHCKKDDTQSGPAQFVLYCFEWRELQEQKQKKGSSSIVERRHFNRVGKRINSRPTPDGRALTRVSTASKEQVKRLHGMTARDYVTSGTLFHIFNDSDSFWVKTLVFNPIGQHHIRSNLLLEGGESIFEDPAQTLLRQAPDSYWENPFNALVEAIPDQLRLMYVKWVTLVFQIFGKLAGTTIAVHVNQMRSAHAGVRGTWYYTKWMCKEGNRLYLIHIVPALVLLYLRFEYAPWLAAHHLKNPRTRLPLSWNDPSQYLESQRDWTWRYWAATGMSSAIFDFFINMINGFIILGLGIKLLFDSVRAMLPNRRQEILAAEHSLVAVTTFMHMCNLHRHICTILHVSGTVIASGNIMMTDMKSVLSILRFTYLYWLGSGIGIVEGLLIGFLASTCGPWGFLIFLATLVPQWYAFKLLDPLEALVVRGIVWASPPVVWLAKQCWHGFLWSYIPLLKCLGIVFLFLLMLRAFLWFHKIVRDPYDVEGTIYKLKRTRALAKATLKDSEMKRIGTYPFGGDIEDVPKDPSPPEGESPAPPQAPEQAQSVKTGEEGQPRKATEKSQPPKPTQETQPQNSKRESGGVDNGLANGNINPNGGSPPSAPSEKSDASRPVPTVPVPDTASGASTGREQEAMDDIAAIFGKYKARRRLQRHFEMLA